MGNMAGKTPDGTEPPGIAAMLGSCGKAGGLDCTKKQTDTQRQLTPHGIHK